MNEKKYLILLLVGLIVSVAGAMIQTVPGYMDAEYYYAGGLQLANGAGFNEPFLWNYLDDPSGIPHHSHTYWMPLPSIIAAAGMLLTGSRTFFSARLLFILLAACVPLVTALLAEELGQDKTNSMLAGLLAAYPGFYVVYLTNTETFTLYMLLGAVFFWVAAKVTLRFKASILKSVTLGITVGLMHLTRAEGLIWLLPALIVVIYDTLEIWKIKAKTTETTQILRIAILYSVVIFTYLLIMMPWYWRNIHIYGSMMSPGGSKTIWMTDYNQTFIYPLGYLNPENWLKMGWQYHIEARWNALLLNLGNLIGVQGEIFLLPLIVMGVLRCRKNPMVWLAGITWTMVLGLMTIVFPYSGPRGGFIHSGAAIQPMLWVMAVVGLDVFIDFGKRIRNWDARTAKPVFGACLVAISAFLSIVIFYARIFGGDIQNPIWEQSWKEHIEIHSALSVHGLEKESVVMINNPPGFFVSTGQPAIVIPDGDLETLVMVAHRYNADYAAIQKDHVVGLAALYKTPEDVTGLRYLGTTGNARLFEIKPELE